MSLQSSPSTMFSEDSPPSYSSDDVADISSESEAATANAEIRSTIEEKVDDEYVGAASDENDDILMMSVNENDDIDNPENAIVSTVNIVESNRQKENISRPSSRLPSIVVVASNTRSSDRPTTEVTAQSDRNRGPRRRSRRYRCNRHLAGRGSNQRNASTQTDTRHSDDVTYSSHPSSMSRRRRHSDADQLPATVNTMYDQLDNALERLYRCSHDELFLHRRNIVDKLAFWNERFHRRLYASSNGGWYWRNQNEGNTTSRDRRCTSPATAKYRCDCSTVHDRAIETTHSSIRHSSADNCDNNARPETTPTTKTHDSSSDDDQPGESEIVVQSSHRRFEQSGNEHMDWAVEASK